MQNLNKYLKVAKEGSLAGGQIAAKGFYKFDRSNALHKSKYYEIFTKYDLASEKKIRQIIRKNFPDHIINGEEKGLRGKDSNYVWQIDPIDGTTNFTIHNPNFAVSVGLEYKGQTIAGAVYLPILSELFWSAKGQGAWLNGKKIKVSKIKNFKDSILAFTFSHNSKHNNNSLKWFKRLHLGGNKCRVFGSACVTMLWVACGRLEGAIMSQMGPWDFSASRLIVLEAGGKITNQRGKSVKTLDASVILTNKLVHRTLINKLKK